MKVEQSGRASEAVMNIADIDLNANRSYDTDLFEDFKASVLLVNGILCDVGRLLDGAFVPLTLANLVKINQDERQIAKCNQSSPEDKPYVTRNQAHKFLSMLTGTWLRRVKVINERIYYKELDGHWTKGPLLTRQMCKDWLPPIFIEVLPYSSEKINVKNMADSFYTAARQSQIDMTSIQFYDCVLMADGTVADTCEDVPRVIIEKPVREALDTGKPTVNVPELQEFLDEIMPNKAIQERLLDRLAMTLVLDPSKKQSLGAACMLYGPKAGNGKTTLIDLLKNALHQPGSSTQAYASFNLSKFEGYSLASMINAILLLNDDGTGEFIEAKVSTNVKTAITAGQLEVRQIYQKPITITPTVQMVCATNALPLSEDKTAGLARRFEWFPFDRQLDGSPERDPWFDKVKSDDAALMLLQMLAIRAVKIIKTGKLTPMPDEMLELLETYDDANRNVIAWLNHIGGVEALKKLSVKESYISYEKYCEDAADTPLGKKKFISQVTTATGLKRKAKKVNDHLYTEMYRLWKDSEEKRGSRQLADATTMIMWVD